MRVALGTWTLQVSDKTGNAGHLAKGTTRCSAAESRTDNAVAVSASGTAVGTTSTGLKTISSSTQALATGTLPDTGSCSRSG